VAGQSKSRESAFFAALNRHAPVRTKRLIFSRWVAIEDFKEKVERRRYLEIILTENDVVANVQNGIGRHIHGSEPVVFKDLAEKEGTRGAETPGHMI
jgi:hypothetical protein